MSDLRHAQDCCDLDDHDDDDDDSFDAAHMSDLMQRRFPKSHGGFGVEFVEVGRSEEENTQKLRSLACPMSHERYPPKEVDQKGMRIFRSHSQSRKFTKCGRLT